MANQRCIAISDDGKFDAVAVFDVSTGKRVRVFEHYEEDAWLSAVANSPDGKVVATAT